MSKALCISVTFLDPRFHGRGDGGRPEWPPSPMRLFQAMVAANGLSLDTDRDIGAALRWLEAQPPPILLTPPSRVGTVCPLYVPNNAMDEVAKAWQRGNSDANLAKHRTLKPCRPTHLLDVKPVHSGTHREGSNRATTLTHLRGGDTVHYIWPMTSHDADSTPVDPLSRAAERTVALGWGIDLVVAQCRALASLDIANGYLERWEVARSYATSNLRCPVVGSLDALRERHVAFLNRLADGTLHPVPPVTTYRIVGYRRSSDPEMRPFQLFELRNLDGKRFRYSQRRFIHIAGMLRHLAIAAMEKAPPDGVDENWVETYIAGHASNSAHRHRQLSYLPLPSIGMEHTDPAVRRVMIAAPIGDEDLLKHVTRYLTGKILEPERGNEFAGLEPPVLIPVHKDRMLNYYVKPRNIWHSVTPVILPGHDDHKPAKTRRLIEKSLEQAGIDSSCSFEWSSYSKFPKMYSAHKYDKNKRPQGYLRPDHLNSQTVVHLTIKFKKGVEVPGPIAIGAGRHCGFGLMAGRGDS